MQMIIEAEELFNAKARNRKKLLKMELLSVEKNADANVTLRYRNEKQWQGRVKIVECDMRQLSEKIRAGHLPPPDLIVSELLGSFGDNELSPECLDGITDVLRPTTLSIPHQYTSYVAPIQSIRLYQKILCCVGGTKYFERGFPDRGRLEPMKLPDGTYSQPYVTIGSYAYLCKKQKRPLRKNEKVSRIMLKG
ncbi:unnamed protein product [Gongylonema pulchrum]|uniref:PRMT5 domain-containing protein n=1 Tax=Gongylonema pulchrum TaxID=637853 RepID=A0A183DAA3_9BILA|nr:unnamed protein product [Gongylonema pulchrum]